MALSTDKLIEQHIHEHESRLKHIDELLHRAHDELEASGEPADVESELRVLRGDREKLAEHVSELKDRPAKDWQAEAFKRAGPMAVWDAVAQRLENVLERLGK